MWYVIVTNITPKVQCNYFKQFVYHIHYYNRKSHKCCDFNYDNPKQPIFDRHPTKYLAEDIMHLLLNPELDKSLICSERPTLVDSSATFIVDIGSLSDVDDIKRDSYGKWNYSGSRPMYFIVTFREDKTVSIEKCCSGSNSDNIYQLRRLYCKHPSNENFRRTVAMITGMMHFYHY